MTFSFPGGGVMIDTRYLSLAVVNKRQIIESIKD